MLECVFFLYIIAFISLCNFHLMFVLNIFFARLRRLLILYLFNVICLNISLSPITIIIIALFYFTSFSSGLSSVSYLLNLVLTLILNLKLNDFVILFR